MLDLSLQRVSDFKSVHFLHNEDNSNGVKVFIYLCKRVGVIAGESRLGLVQMKHKIVSNLYAIRSCDAT